TTSAALTNRWTDGMCDEKITPSGALSLRDLLLWRGPVRAARLLARADGVEALAQRLHEIDDFRRRLGFGRHDLPPFDLRVDDLAQAHLVFVLVRFEIEIARKGANDLVRELHFVGLDLLRHVVELLDLLHAAD